MRRIIDISLFILIITVVFGCEDDIFPTLEETPSQIVVDAWIDNFSQTQTINITRTLEYYDASQAPGVENAIVIVSDEAGNIFNFTEVQPGLYQWSPNNLLPNMGVVGTNYDLTIQIGNTLIQANSTMNRVPDMDSIKFRFEEESIEYVEGYYAEFFARDFEGNADTYWIKAFKNGVFLNRPEEINIAFDAGFSEGGGIDNLVFIPPIRDAINPFDPDFELPGYDPGDSVYVEIHSISNEAFDFMTELFLQISRPGGFGELFAVPLANLPTNMNSDQDVLGFFNVAAVSTEGKRLDPNNLPVN